MAPYIPLGTDGYSNDKEATATCFCGAVQLVFNLDGVVDTFACNCTDCHKVTATMFASNFIVYDKDFKWIRGKDKLTRFARDDTTTTGSDMATFFCSVCGTIMNRVSSGSPGMNFLRIGTVDDFNLQATTLKPKTEIFTNTRFPWVHGVDGAKQHEGFGYAKQKREQAKLPTE